MSVLNSDTERYSAESLFPSALAVLALMLWLTSFTPLRHPRLPAVEGGALEPLELPAALSTGCQKKGFRWSIAVAVRIKTRFSRGFIPIGRESEARQWLTFDRSSRARKLMRTIAEGLVFRERLGCITKALGRVRYRLVREEGTVGRQVERPFPLTGPRCRSAR